MIKLRPLVSALALALYGAGTLAQTPMLEEVYVTAQKRGESLQDVPVAVDVFNAETIQEAGIQQVVRVTWDGGVRLPNGDEPGDAERRLYRVTVKRADGLSDEIKPVALAELGDGDNNHFLCLGTADPAVAVSFPAGRLVDPNRDLNPDTHIAVRGG